MQDMCGVLLSLADQKRKKQAEKMLSILHSRSFDLAVLKTSVKMLTDCEELLKRGADRFVKDGDSEDMSSKWKNTVMTWRPYCTEEVLLMF